MNQQKIISIGIVEDSIERMTFKLLKEILTMYNYNIYYENKEKNIAILTKENNNIILMDIRPNIFNSIVDIGIEYNILVHTFLHPKEYENEKLKKMFKTSKHIIVNCDECNLTSILEDNIESLVITYGFNNKATLNPSSYNIHDLIEANICLQREIRTINNDIIEPFELPVKINSQNKVDIYSTLGVIASVLLLGIDISSVNPFTIFNSNK
ncbi:hypothetical protein [Tissierella sp.]|uniref:hypothetical protein n=1 Tax=Tissierella sp. TaxID=41274 RepID=UPI0028578EE1|nr:hypothetical protein [Tissierella sp.]MDR7856483.1 hypothetical protein [Tissierella sp.]